MTTHERLTRLEQNQRDVLLHVREALRSLRGLLQTAVDQQREINELRQAFDEQDDSAAADWWKS